MGSLRRSWISGASNVRREICGHGPKAPQRWHVLVVHNDLGQHPLDVRPIGNQPNMSHAAAKSAEAGPPNWQRPPPCMPQAHHHVSSPPCASPHTRFVEVEEEGRGASRHLALQVSHPLPTHRGLG